MQGMARDRQQAGVRVVVGHDRSKSSKIRRARKGQAPRPLRPALANTQAIAALGRRHRKSDPGKHAEHEFASETIQNYACATRHTGRSPQIVTR
jgi:hypothetical protein